MKLITTHATTRWIFAAAAVVPLVVSVLRAVEGRAAAVITAEMVDLEEKIRVTDANLDQQMEQFKNPPEPTTRPTPGEMGGRSLIGVEMQKSGIASIWHDPEYKRADAAYQQKAEKIRKETIKQEEAQRKAAEEANQRSIAHGKQKAALEEQRNAAVAAIRTPNPVPEDWSYQYAALAKTIGSGYEAGIKAADDAAAAAKNEYEALRRGAGEIHREADKKLHAASAPLTAEIKRASKRYFSTRQ